MKAFGSVSQKSHDPDTKNYSRKQTHNAETIWTRVLNVMLKESFPGPFSYAQNLEKKLKWITDLSAIQ